MRQNPESTHAASSRAGQRTTAPASSLRSRTEGPRASTIRSLDDELRALRHTFYEEAEERLAEVEGLLLVLEQRPDDLELTNTIFRAVHSVKGGAAACEFSELASFAHAFESLLACLRKGQLRVTRRSLDVLLNATDVLNTLLACAKDGQGRGESAAVERALAAIRQELAELPASEEPAGPVVDLSAGLVIWDDEPAAPSAPAAARSHAPSGMYARTERPTHTPAPSMRTASLPQPSRAPPAEPTRAHRPPASIAPAHAPELRDYPLDAVLVRLGDQLYGLATAQVEAFLQPCEAALREVPFHGTVLLTDARGVLQLVRLETLLGRPPSPAPVGERVAVIVGMDARRSAVLVDAVLTQGSLLVKRLEPNLQGVPGIVGAAEVEGELALVLALDRLL